MAFFFLFKKIQIFYGYDLVQIKKITPMLHVESKAPAIM